MNDLKQWLENKIVDITGQDYVSAKMRFEADVLTEVVDKIDQLISKQEEKSGEYKCGCGARAEYGNEDNRLNFQTRCPLLPGGHNWQPVVKDTVGR